ncbi:LysR family transcriptional regulator [Rothia terrae]|uniref:LysR family transcriptional regulator n=1 Tax=Rothia terrae TaxID=396015 RepID=UPI0033E5A4AD
MYDLKRLEILYEISNYGSLVAAADVLGYDPSTVSAHLSKLQAEVGHTLYEKSGRGVVLTARGQELAQYAGQMLAIAERARIAMENPATTTPRTLRVASFNSAARYAVPQIFEQLEKRAPHLTLELTQLEAERSISELTKHHFDVAVAEEYEGRPVSLPPSLTRVELWQDPIVIVASQSVVTAQPLKQMGWLAELPWCMEPVGTQLRTWSDAFLTARNIRAVPRFVSTDLSWQLQSAYGGHAVAILPHLVLDAIYRVEGQASSSRGVPQGLWVSEPLGKRTVFAVIRKSSATDPAISTILDILREMDPARG